MKTLNLTLVTMAAAVSIASGSAMADSNKGYEIAARADRSDRGYGDSSVEMTMVLRNAAGAESSRQLRILTLEMPNESVGDKSLVLFSSPRDVEGTALLSHAKILEPDSQWLFLPALKRVKRIASANKSGPFVGSEFSFEDFTSLELEKYSYNYLETVQFGDMTVDVVEAKPRYENSGYTRLVSYIDQKVHQIRQIEFYDRRGDQLKTLKLEDYREYDGVWRPQVMRMVNHQTGKETDLVYGEYQFATGVNENDFVQGRLRNLR